MKRLTSNVALTVGAMVALFAYGSVQAQTTQRQATNMPASSTSSTTASSATQKASADTRASGKAGNMPAASTSSTTSAAKDRGNKQQERQAQSRSEAASEPPDPASFGLDAAVIDLDKLAPVEVIDLQARLKARDLYHGKLDGIVGPQTRQALKLYFVQQAELAGRGKLDTSSVSFCGPTLIRQ